MTKNRCVKELLEGSVFKLLYMINLLIYTCSLYEPIIDAQIALQKYHLFQQLAANNIYFVLLYNRQRRPRRVVRMGC